MLQAEVHAESESDDDDGTESAGEEQKIRGCPKSGRKWKTVPLQKTSKMKKDSAFNTSWDRKMRERQTLKAVKGIQNGLRDDKRQKLEEKKKRRIEQEQRRQENLKRAEVVQEIKSSHKLKRAKKKLLRKIEKRDTTVVDKS